MRLETLTNRLIITLRASICPFHKLVAYAPQSGMILDAGSGYGIMSLELAKNKKLNIVGIDIDRKKVNWAKRFTTECENVALVVSDIRYLPCQPRFDCIICIDILHHISGNDLISVIRSLKTALKDGGRLVVKEVDTRPFFKFVWNWLHDLVISGIKHFNYLHSTYLIGLMKAQGFTIIKTEYIPNLLYAHYVVVCTKGADTCMHERET